MTLVYIPSNRTLDGMSPPGELNTRQRIDERALPRLQAFADAFYAEFATRLITTEGARSRPRQDAVWAAHLRHLAGGPWAPLAARPYTSRHDEVEHGNAIDFGSNISKSRSPQAAWAHEHGPSFGVYFTVPSESWHADISTAGFAGVGNPLPEDDMPTAEEVAEAILHRFVQTPVGDRQVHVLLGQIANLAVSEQVTALPAAVATKVWAEDAGGRTAKAQLIRATRDVLILWNQDDPNEDTRRALVTADRFEVVTYDEAVGLRRIIDPLTVTQAQWDAYKARAVA